MPSTILTTGVRRFGIAFLSKRLQKTTEKTAKVKHPERPELPLNQISHNQETRMNSLPSVQD